MGESDEIRRAVEEAWPEIEGPAKTPGPITSAADVEPWIVKASREGDQKGLRQIQHILELAEQAKNAKDHLTKIRKALSTQIIKTEEKGEAAKVASLKEQRQCIFDQLAAIEEIQKNLASHGHKADRLIPSFIQKEPYEPDFVKLDAQIDTFALDVLKIEIQKSADVNGLVERFQLSEKEKTIAERIRVKLSDGEKNRDSKEKGSEVFQKLDRAVREGYDMAATLISHMVTKKDKDQTFYDTLETKKIPELELKALGMSKKGADVEAGKKALGETGDLGTTGITGEGTISATRKEIESLLDWM